MPGLNKGRPNYGHDHDVGVFGDTSAYLTCP